MPLPASGTEWPPRAHAKIHREIDAWAAWWTGDRDWLASVYGTTPSATHMHAGLPHRGGVVGGLARMFWGQPVPVGQESTKLHVPTAADIASTSAGLLFAEPPTLTLDDESTQTRLVELFDETLWDQLMNAAELQAGLGGVFLRVGWDQDAADRPLVSVIGPDFAVPTFRWGQLAEVTFTWVLPSDDNRIPRHLERHAPGVVEHGLYLGDSTQLGRLVPLTEHPDTAALAGVVDASSAIDTKLDTLDVVYVSNRVARRWRGDQIGSNLGQPDIAGVEPLLDALDEAWTAWMRDIRLGKARAVVPQAHLDTAGPGRAASFNLDRELFVGMNALPGAGEMPLHVLQPAIRHAEHAATTTALLERVVDGAGYSAQTFGLSGEVAMTATESNARERKTNQTRAVKIRHWQRALPELSEIMLAVDQVVFGRPGKVDRPTVTFPPVARDSIETLARTVSTLGDAASSETKVRLLHPTWDDDQVASEVAALGREYPMGPLHVDADGRLAALPTEE